jgi:hypothetical protein
MKIRCVEIGVALRRRLEETAGAGIMLLMIDECPPDGTWQPAQLRPG